MKLIYLACPYTDKDENIQKIRAIEANYFTALILSLHTDVAVFSPLTHGTGFDKHLPDDLRESHRFWMKQCIAMLRRCDEVWVLPLNGWDVSKGVEMEIDLAHNLDMPVRYIQDPSRLPTLVLDRDEEVRL